MSNLKKLLIIYDFDWSLADKDSDHHILEKYDQEGEEALFYSKLWMETMHQRLEHIYKKGITANTLLNSFNDFPISSNMVQAIQLAKANNADIYIISDGNSLFLNTILNIYGIRNCINEIITNKAKIEDEDKGGRIVLEPVVELNSHGCKRIVDGVGLTCSANLCKGDQVQRLMKNNTYSKIIYIGDGKNDFCAACQLSKNDLLLARRHRALEKIILKDKEKQIQAEIQFWQEAEEVLERYKNEFK